MGNVGTDFGLPAFPAETKAIDPDLILMRDTWRGRSGLGIFVMGGLITYQLVGGSGTVLSELQG